MTDTTMPMGLLGSGLDPDQLQQLMAQFGATDADKQSADKQALFALGFGLLQGRRHVLLQEKEEGQERSRLLCGQGWRSGMLLQGRRLSDAQQEDRKLQHQLTFVSHW